MYQRSQPPSRLSMSSFAARFSSSASRPIPGAGVAPRFSTSKESLLPATMIATPVGSGGDMAVAGNAITAASANGPLLCGVPLKYVSLLTLAVQNAALSIVMHYSRVSIPASKAYSPASAVLLNELLKGSISYVIAFMRTSSNSAMSPMPRKATTFGFHPSSSSWRSRLRQLNSEIFSMDCLKLSIPAILYVIQNSLQFVAISNLPVASFQVAYQMKILTTAAFSVALLGKRLTKTKWLALLFLALGVGIVQIQTATGNVIPPSKVYHEAVGSAAAAAPKYIHHMNTLKGFAAVIAACFTSGAAGVYFEMVLKNSKADLWVRNVQLSLFSLIPALLPVMCTSTSNTIFSDLLKNFGAWAWATVAIQVGFATSLSIILSFLASVVLFDFQITSGFLLGSSTVLAATMMYNSPSPRDNAGVSLTLREREDSHVITSPIARSDPILGEKASLRKSGSFGGSSQSLSSLLGMTTAASKERLAREEDIALMSHSSRTTPQPQFGVSALAPRSPSPPPSQSSTPKTLHVPGIQW
ncbi:nucleotide-sugar transporter [Phellopilus nigrolimitatus]|nr:nucleotide-sugar transporter [Phellopilus nigrolimitatus]